MLLFEFDLSIRWPGVPFNSEMFFLKYFAVQNNRKYLNFSKIRKNEPYIIPTEFVEDIFNTLKSDKNLFFITEATKRNY